MGGCRCAYRRCENSTTQSPELHYFHFPVRDPARCEQWIVNARKPAFRNLDKSRLRNKVVCSLHFEEKCFINENHDRLIHNAVPTLGFEDDEEDNTVIQNMLLPPAPPDNNDIMLIPLNEDNTKFILPDVGFQGMSYTLCDDNLIPTVKTEYAQSNVQDAKSLLGKHRAAKNLPTKTVIKRIKTNLPLKQLGFSRSPSQDTNTTSIQLPQKLFTKPLTPSQSEAKAEKKVSSFSVTTINGDLSIQPVKQDHIETINDKLNVSLADYQEEDASLNHNTPLLDNDISLEMKSDNEYTISVVPLASRFDRRIESEAINQDDNSQDLNTSSENDFNIEVVEENKVENEVNVKQATDSPEKEYIQMIKSNSKQIKQLKKLLQKQEKINQFLLQRKRMPHFKPRNLSKSFLVESLKQHLPPSLLAIIKLEVLPVEDVVLTDSEEKFVTDLYTKYPECYNVLKNKFHWNLPSTDKEQVDELK